jgi:hypothetical protein
MNLRIVLATPIDAPDILSADVKFGYRMFVESLKAAGIVTVETDFAPDVVRARNRVAARILVDHPAMTHVFWLDSDMWAENPRIVQEMAATGHDLVAAPYTNKREPLRWIHQPLEAPQVEQDGILEVKYVGFGFTMTSRRCLERMSETNRRYRDWPHPLKVPNIFGQLYDRVTDSPDPEDEVLLSEDYSFCKRWRDLGGKVLLYTRGGVVRHAGYYAWSARDFPGAS